MALSRARFGGLGMPIAWAVLLLASQARGAPIHVGATGLPCPTDMEIPARIERLLGQRLDANAAFEISIAPSGPKLLVIRLTSGDASIDRFLAFSPTDCAELAQAVVEIARGWLAAPLDLPVEPAAAAPQGPPSSPTEAASALDGRASPATFAGATPSERRLSVLAGGFAAPGAPHPEATFSAGLDWDYSRSLGAVVSAGHELARERVIDAGSISASLWTFDLLARVRVLSTEAGGLDLLAGPSLHVIDARSLGFGSRSPELFERLAATLVLRWRQSVVGPVSALAAVGASLRGQEERLFVRNVAGFFALSPLRVGASIGASIDL